METSDSVYIKELENIINLISQNTSNYDLIKGLDEGIVQKLLGQKREKSKNKSTFR